MRNFAAVFPFCLVLLAACDVPPEATVQRLSAAQLAAGACRGSDNPQCRFINTPVKLASEGTRLPGRPLTFFPLADRLEFVDGQSRRWTARKGVLTDGASIPQVFVPVIGQPTSPEFLNAAAVHDAYCGIGNESNPEYQSLPWEVVHRMFHDALIVGGTPDSKAKIMFAAVYLGGPRWNEPRRPSAVGLVPDAALQAAMRQAQQFIEREQPTLEQLIIYLRRQELQLIASAHPGDSGGAEAPQAGGENNGGTDGDTGGEEYPGDDGYPDDSHEDGYPDYGYESSYPGDSQPDDGYGDDGGT